MTSRSFRNLEFCCGGCGRKISLPPSAAGKPIACPACGLRTRVPGHTSTPSADAARSRPTAARITKGSSVPAVLPVAAMAPQPPARLIATPAFIAAAAFGVLLTISTPFWFASPRNALTPRGASTGRVAEHEVTDSSTANPPRLRTPDRSPHIIELKGRTEAVLRDALRPLVASFAALKATAADDATERSAALIRLRMYRLLCGLSEEQLVLDDALNDDAAAAAKVCHRLGRLTHNPSNPGLPAADFARASRGAMHGNLAAGMGDLIAAIDGWMDDSDPDNLASLGHRRWCLNPPMKRVGFGRADRYFVMWAHDASGTTLIAQPAICFPPPGHVPIDMFRPHYAWSVTLDPRRFQKPREGAVSIVMKRWGGTAPTGSPLPLNFFAVETRGFGIDNCLIFRPDGIGVAIGDAYWVEIKGLRDHDDREVHLQFLTQFTQPAVTGL